MTRTLLHWEYPLYCVITALYIPILSAVVLIFTGLRIRATLRRRRGVQTRLRQNIPPTSDNNTYDQQSSGRRRHAVGSRRTLKLLTFTGVAYFTCWGPYAVVTLTQMLVSSFSPPSGVQFAVMWLANANSAVNVFIYSYTNAQFRRQCVLLMSRVCCSRLSPPEYEPAMSTRSHAATCPVFRLYRRHQEMFFPARTLLRPTSLFGFPLCFILGQL